jgi:hypothetical protein
MMTMQVTGEVDDISATAMLLNEIANSAIRRANELDKAANREAETWRKIATRITLCAEFVEWNAP